MRHQMSGVRLSRTSAHRKAMFSNMVSSLFEHGRIKTTDAKAKAARRIAERTISIARRVEDVLSKKPETRSTAERARLVHAYRQARMLVRDKEAVVKLFDELVPVFEGRNGGYTRVIKGGQRRGDAAPMAYLELVTEPVSSNSTDNVEVTNS